MRILDPAAPLALPLPRGLLVAFACGATLVTGCPSDPGEDEDEAGEDDGGGGGSSGPPPFTIVDAGPGDDDDDEPGPPDAGPPVVCAEDDDEDNDTQATATLLVEGTERAARFCGGDDDWYAVAVAGDDCSVAVTVAVDPEDDGGGADLDVLLVDEDGAVVGSATGFAGRAALNARTTSRGRYAARVRGLGSADVGYGVTFAVACAGDAVCPADDAAEDNDTAASAAPLVRGLPVDAALCGADVDFWSIPTTPGCFADVVATFDDDAGDVDLYLAPRVGTGDLASSRGTSDREQITRVLAAPDDVVVRVELFGGTAPAGSAYRLFVDEICASDLGCPGDDPHEDNDTRQTATTLGRDDRTLGIVCGSDEDFFRVVPQSGCTTTFRVGFVDADGDIDIALLDGAGATLASSRSSGDEEVVTHSATNANAVVLHVFGFDDAQNDYQVTTTTTCP